MMLGRLIGYSGSHLIDQICIPGGSQTDGLGKYSSVPAGLPREAFIPPVVRWDPNRAIAGAPWSVWETFSSNVILPTRSSLAHHMGELGQDKLLP